MGVDGISRGARIPPKTAVEVERPTTAPPAAAAFRAAFAEDTYTDPPGGNNAPVNAETSGGPTSNQVPDDRDGGLIGDIVDAVRDILGSIFGSAPAAPPPPQGPTAGLVPEDGGGGPTAQGPGGSTVA